MKTYRVAFQAEVEFDVEAKNELVAIRKAKAIAQHSKGEAIYFDDFTYPSGAAYINLKAKPVARDLEE